MRYNCGEGVIEMSANTTYNVRIDKEMRKKADILYKNMGLTLSSAINLFITQSVIQGKLPLTEIVAEPFYTDILLRDAEETDKALEDGTATIYDTPEELFASWENV